MRSSTSISISISRWVSPHHLWEEETEAQKDNNNSATKYTCFRSTSCSMSSMAMCSMLNHVTIVINDPSWSMIQAMPHAPFHISSMILNHFWSMMLHNQCSSMTLHHHGSWWHPSSCSICSSIMLHSPSVLCPMNMIHPWWWWCSWWCSMLGCSLYGTSTLVLDSTEENGHSKPMNSLNMVIMGVRMFSSCHIQQIKWECGGDVWCSLPNSTKQTNNWEEGKKCWPLVVLVLEPNYTANLMSLPNSELYWGEWVFSNNGLTRTRIPLSSNQQRY